MLHMVSGFYLWLNAPLHSLVDTFKGIKGVDLGLVLLLATHTLCPLALNALDGYS